MLSVQLDALQGIAILEPHSEGDRSVSREKRRVEGHRGAHREVSRLGFLRRVALCADSKLGDVAPRLARHFVKAEVRAFKAAEFEAAKAWAAGGG